jgi:hypothetical protein
MPDSVQLIMDYGRVSAAGQAAGEAGVSLAMTVDQTAPGCTAAARATPAWGTSQAILDLHVAHTQTVNGHIEVIRSTAAGIEASVDITRGADSSAASAAGSITGGF